MRLSIAIALLAIVLLAIVLPAMSNSLWLAVPMAQRAGPRQRVIRPVPGRDGGAAEC